MPDFFEKMMEKMGDEFPQYSRVHADWEFALVDKTTRAVKNTKKFRMISLQNTGENHNHIAIIIQDLSNEYIQLPDHVRKFLLQLAQESNSNNICRLEFTGQVYLYTDKLLVAEDSVKKHFEKNNLSVAILQYRT